jgi:undecaprenyl-diphosphatase
MLNHIILGIIQGLTEFLPVSSSAHLVIMQRVLGFRGEEVVLSVILHLGTTLALVIFFFNDILKLLRDRKMLSYVIIVTAITGIIGLSGKDFFEKLFSQPKLAALSLIVTGAVLLITKKFMQAKRDTLNAKDAFILGVTQGIAIIPGISRSGITVSTLLFRGIDRETAFRFSFIASIPAILGAALLEGKDICRIPPSDILNLFTGFIFSFLTGILSLLALRLVLRRAKFHYFGYYCIFIAIMAFLFVR